MLSLLTRQLAELGVEAVTYSENSVAALSVVIEDAAGTDLLFLDLNMPGLDGVEFMRELAAISFDGAVILISGEDEKILAAAERLALSERLNVAGRLSKPVTLEQLQTVLARVPATRTTTRPDKVAPTRRVSASELRKGIEAGELVNHYQPQVAFADGRLVGVEALVRWRRASGEMVYPDRFIPLAESSGIIRDLTWAVARAALADAREWFAAGHAVRLSLNITMQDLTALDFPDRLTELCDEFGIPCDHVVVEITESRLTEDWQKTLDVATRLRLRRIGLAIDDYGTGYSTLSQLRDLPFDELKLDRSFIHGAGDATTLQAIVAPHLDMANNLGIRVVAEGIEDQDDWTYMSRSGCSLGQGYLMGRPMPGNDLIAWTERWQSRYPKIRAAAEDKSATQ